MREKWKLCVVSGSIMVFFVLGTLVLLNYTMASADNRGREFAVTQAVSGSSVSGSSVSGQAVSGEGISGDPFPHKSPVENESSQSDGPKKKNGPKITNENEAEANIQEPDEEDDSEGTSCYSSYSYSHCITERPQGGYTDEDKIGHKVCSYAREFLGVRYVYGGTSLPDLTETREEDAEGSLNGAVEGSPEENYGVDCSGLVMKVFEEFGIKLPRTVKEQAEEGEEVKLKDIQPGDIIFYGASDSAVTHCGIYAGNGTVIHVSAQTKVVTTDNMNYRRIVKVKRVVSE